MKYKYNDQWKEVTVKAGDTLPIGTIVDYDGDTVPSGYEEVNSYSTTEVKTGDTWIDGKPIYRIVYSGNIANGSTLFTNVDAIINISGYGFLGDTSRKVILNGIAADIPSTLFSCFYGLNNTIEFYAKYGGNATTAYNSNIILEYTKTTD